MKRSWTTAALVFALVLPTAAQAGHWEGYLPGPITVICGGDGLSCARYIQDQIYDPGQYGGCYYDYSSQGQLVSATCEGWATPPHIGVRNGFASLVCDSGEQRGATGCFTGAPVDKIPQTCEGSPTDVVSGMKTERVVDFTTAGPQPLTFSRTYVSNTDYWRGDSRWIGTRLGRGWRSNYDAAAFFFGSGSGTPLEINFVLPGGEEYRFAWTFSGTDYEQIQFNSSTGTWAANNRKHWATLVKAAANSLWKLTTNDDTVWSFD